MVLLLLLRVYIEGPVGCFYFFLLYFLQAFYPSFLFPSSFSLLTFGLVLLSLRFTHVFLSTHLDSLLSFFNLRLRYVPTLARAIQNVLQSCRTLLRLQMRLLPTLHRPLLSLWSARTRYSGKDRPRWLRLRPTFCSCSPLFAEYWSLAGFWVFQFEGVVQVEVEVEVEADAVSSRFSLVGWTSTSPASLSRHHATPRLC